MNLKDKIHLKWSVRHRPKPKGQWPRVWTYEPMNLEWTYLNIEKAQKGLDKWQTKVAKVKQIKKCFFIRKFKKCWKEKMSQLKMAITFYPDIHLGPVSTQNE